MKVFDIVDINNGVDSTLTSRLGFSRIYALGRDLDIVQKPGQSVRKQIIRSKDAAQLIKAIRNQETIGISLEDNEIVAKALAAAKEAEKPVIIDIHYIFSPYASDRYRNIGRIRGLVKAALAAKCEIILISGAKSLDYMLSPAQLIEIAKFLGMQEGNGRMALSRLGDYIDS